MRTIKLTIEYDGTKYCGWQVQPSRKKSIQGVIQDTLAGILREKVQLKASGRTDAGVHATGQVAHFMTGSALAVEKILRALNALLPESIVILRAQEVPLHFHSRFHAVSKIYRYTILNRACPCALRRNEFYHYPYPLDIGRMNKAAKYLIGRHDFKAFQTAGGRKDSVRTIRCLSVSGKGDFVSIQVEADGFLYNMVRTIVGTLIEIGRGRFPPEYMKHLLLQRDRRYAGPTAPAKGLCLRHVKYRR